MAEPNVCTLINEEEIFERVLSLPVSEQMASLRAACEGYPAVCVRLEEMLVSLEGGGFMGNPAARTVSAEVEAEFARLKPEEGGERIGNYKLLQQIGEGGFGVVWMAEQEKPIRRRVALKIIKLGMDTKEVIARFEQERQALAMMDHPNIARVLDAGATPLGRPFFAMELVKGVKITEFCDQAKLSTADRLGLFIQVCNAIQHAHQKGIIHRDLKPSNILVTLHDGVPVPKVIDFGVAKATQQQRLTDLTLFTKFEQMVGTPLYMSPEQAELSGLDIDTRSDIYSLGVLLYELLTGRTPFDPEELMRQGLDEIRRVIREEEPQKPSTFVSTMALDVRTNVAQHRQTDFARLTGQIRGDLDWIVMKALEKDRARRYETANGLAKDIERHLGSEPVQARPPSQVYRFRRFARRNKAAFAAGSAVLAALLIGLGVSTWMFFKEKEAREAQSQERKKAEAEASKSRQVAQFLTDMLNGVGPSVALGRDTRMLQEILDKTAERLGNDLKDQPAVEADLRHIIGKVYVELGNYEKATAMHGEALAIRKKLHGNEHADVAQSMQNLAVVLLAQGKLVEAETMHREALARYRKLAGNESPEVASSLSGCAKVLSAQGKPVEAETMHREALAMQRKLLGDENPAVAESLTNVAAALLSQGRLREAETMNRDALALTRKLVGNEHPRVAGSLNNLANALVFQNKPAEAETMYREALAMRRQLLGNEHPDIAASLNNLGNVLDSQNKPAEAEIIHQEALAMWRKLLGPEHPSVAMSLSNLGNLFSKQGKFVEAETMHRESLAIRRKMLGLEHPQVEVSLSELVGALRSQGKLDAAEIVCQEALAMNREFFGNEHPAVAQALSDVADVLWDQGKIAEAETMHREALAIRIRTLGVEHPHVEDSRRKLVSRLRTQGRLPAAETVCRELLTLARERFGGEHTAVAQALSSVAEVLWDQGKLAEAETMEREALAMRRQLLGNEHPDVTQSLSNLGDTLGGHGKNAEAEAMHREALATRIKTLGVDHPQVEDSRRKLVSRLRPQGKLPAAEMVSREVLALTRERFGSEHPAVAQALSHVADLLRDQGKLAEAEMMHREALAMRRKLLGNEHPDVAQSLGKVADFLRDKGKLAEAETMHREALAMTRKLLGNEHPDVAQSLANLAVTLRSQGKLAESEIICREALRIGRNSPNIDPANLEMRTNDLAETLYRQNKYVEAEPLYREVVASRQARLGADKDNTIGTIASLARLLADWAWTDWGQRSETSPVRNDQSGSMPTDRSTPHERAEEAEHLLRDCLANRLRNPVALPWRIGELRSRLGDALLVVAVTDPALTIKSRQPKFVEAETLLMEGNGALQKDQMANSKYKRDALTRLVRLYEAWKKKGKVAEWRKTLAEFDQTEAKKDTAEKID